MKPGLTITRDRVKQIMEAVKAVAGTSVLVGVPSDHTLREGADQKLPFNNAAIGYVSEFGAPDVNIPARPWLIPSVTARKADIAARFKAAGTATMEGKHDVAQRELSAAGMLVMSEAQKRITAGLPPPLADSTLRARARRRKGKGVGIRKGAQAELASRAIGNLPGTSFAKPLIDTGQFRRSISYVLRGANGTRFKSGG